MFSDWFGSSDRVTQSPKRGRMTREQLQTLIDKAQAYDDLHEEYRTLQEKYQQLAQKNESLADNLENLSDQNEELLENLRDLEQSKASLQETAALGEKYLQSLKRLQADFDNYQKRVERQGEQVRKFAAERVLRKLIEFNEDLKRFRDSLAKVEDFAALQRGVGMLVKNFEKLLEEEGVRPIEAKGQPFDPMRHEAVELGFVEDEDTPEDIVLEEISKGYTFHDKVLRPARVRVSKRAQLAK